MADHSPIPAGEKKYTFLQVITAFAVLDRRAKEDTDYVKSIRARIGREFAKRFREEGTQSVAIQIGGKKIGTASLTTPQDRPMVNNPAAFLAWVEANHPDQIDYTPRVKDTFVRRFITAGDHLALDSNEDGQPIVVDTKLGVEVDGVKIIPAAEDPAPRFSVRITDKDALLAVSEGYDFTPLDEPKAIEGVVDGEVVDDEATFVADADGNIVDADVVPDDETGAAA